jgi:hypothetical protein
MNLDVSNSNRRFCLLISFAALFFLLTSFAIGDELTGDQKLAIAQQVYDRIVQAIGDSRPPPRLRMRSSVQVAVYWPDRHEIDLDEKAFDLCEAQPDPNGALSVLLGHELAHYYGHHGWTQDFGNSAPPDLADQLKILAGQDRLRCEMEADYFGGYYGYLAGYDTLGEFPKLIESIYHHYQSMAGYPTLSEREAIAQQAQEKLAKLIPVFEAGNVLLALRQYDSAAQCFDFIAVDFPSREILNNAGVARAQEALALLRGDAELVKYVYPFELDADTRLRRDHTMARGLDDATRRQAYTLLIAAERCFDESKTKDPEYAPAYVNLAGIYDLLGEENLAAAFADKAGRVATDSSDTLSIGDARIMQGIVDAREGKISEAAQVFQSVQTTGGATADLAGMNWDIVQGKAPVASESPSPPSTQPTPETIADAAAGNIAAMDDPPYKTISLTNLDADEPDLTVRSKETDSWTGYRVEAADRIFVAYCTHENFTGHTARGIKIGDDLGKVLSTYGEPTDVTAGRQSNLYRFDSVQLIVQIGSDRKVTGWMIYSTQ